MNEKRIPAIVNAEGAWNAAQHTNSNPIRAIMEFIENGEDADASTISIEIQGKKRRGKNGEDLILVSGIDIVDDGKGMFHDVVVVKYRGIHHNLSQEHASDEKNKLMGLGVQSGHRYFDNIFIETTTKELIPHKMGEWSEAELTQEVVDALPFISKQYEELSCLKGGDYDTEVRKYRMGREINDANIIEFSNDTTANEHYTKVSLRNPVKSKPVILGIRDIERLIEHRVTFLSRNGTKITLKVPALFKNEREYTDAFYKHHPVPSTDDANQGTLCKIFGNVKDGITVLDDNGEEVLTCMKNINEFIKAHKDVPNVNVDIWVYKDQIDTGDGACHADIVESVCGSNLDDTWRTSDKLPNRMMSLLKLSGSSYQGSISSRIHGALWTRDSKLKTELVNNRSNISLDQQNVKEYYALITIFLKYVGNAYQSYTNGDMGPSQIENLALTKELRKMIDPALKMLLGAGSNKSTNGSNTVTRSNGNSGSRDRFSSNKLWFCTDCEALWKVNGDFIPTQCCEGAINRKKAGKGCGSKNVSPYHRYGVAVSDISISDQPISGYNTVKTVIDEGGGMSFEIWKWHPKFLKITLDHKNQVVGNTSLAHMMYAEMKASMLVAVSGADEINDCNQKWIKGEWEYYPIKKKKQMEKYYKNKLVPSVNIYDLLQQ